MRPRTADPSSARRSAPHRHARLAVLLLASVVLSACEAPQSALDPKGIWADRPHTLFLVVIGIAAVVFVLVMGLLLFSVWRYRERDTDDANELPVQVHGNTALELTWTIIPALILAGIAVPTVQLIFELEEEDPDAMEIEVVGHRWWWEYRYEVPDGVGDGEIVEVQTANELVIPEGTEIRLAMTAEEIGSAENAVLHSYWVPKLAGKKDVVPGRINYLRMNAPVTGEATEYLGQCAEYCGLSHANMRHRVITLPQDEYDAWLDNQATTPPIPEEGSELRPGYDLVMSNTCVGCHAISGTEAGGITGPNLTRFGTRSVYAGAIYDVADREQLEAWILNAPEQKAMHPEQRPAIGMPSFEGQFTDEEVSSIVDYLLSLDGPVLGPDVQPATP